MCRLDPDGKGDDHLHSGFYPSHDVAFIVEEERDRRDTEMRADALGDSVFVPILVGAAGNMEPEDDQISVEVSESIGDCDDLILIPDSPSGL